MSRILRTLAVAGVVVAAVVLILVMGTPTQRDVAVWAARDRPAALVLFVLVYVAATLLPLPKAVLSIAAGAVFGISIGLAVVEVGAVVGACVAFAVARVLGQDALERRVGSHLACLHALLDRRAFTTILGLRLVPLVPFTALNYVAGLTGVSWGAYTLATMLGILPGVSVSVVLGAESRSPGSWPFLATLAALVVFSGSAFVVSRRHRSATSDTSGAAS